MQVMLIKVFDGIFFPLINQSLLEFTRAPALVPLCIKAFHNSPMLHEKLPPYV